MDESCTLPWVKNVMNTDQYSKTCHKRPLKKDQKMVFKTDHRLMQAISIVEYSKRAFCNNFEFH